MLVDLLPEPTALPMYHIEQIPQFIFGFHRQSIDGRGQYESSLHSTARRGCRTVRLLRGGRFGREAGILYHTTVVAFTALWFLLTTMGVASAANQRGRRVLLLLLLMRMVVPAAVATVLRMRMMVVMVVVLMRVLLLWLLLLLVQGGRGGGGGAAAAATTAPSDAGPDRRSTGRTMADGVVAVVAAATDAATVASSDARDDGGATARSAASDAATARVLRYQFTPDSYARFPFAANRQRRGGRRYASEGAVRR